MDIEGLAGENPDHGTVFLFGARSYRVLANNFFNFLITRS